MDNLFFESWQSLARVFIATIIAYIALLIILRATGKRTLSKMNAFDFIITIALGSAFASLALNTDIPLLNGVLVLFLLVILQFFISWLSVRVKKFKKIITGEPTLLLYRGEVIEQNLKKERILLEEIYVAARSNGVSNLEEIDAVILETNGELTIIKELKGTEPETISDVKK
jgi:uncharacterized membrane protein YcaP (DUF421 family)